LTHAIKTKRTSAYGLGFADTAALLADDDRDLGLAFEDRGRHSGRTIVSPRPMIAPGDLWKALIGASVLRVPFSI
jgi:hypothetical protein